MASSCHTWLHVADTSVLALPTGLRGHLARCPWIISTPAVSQLPTISRIGRGSRASSCHCTISSSPCVRLRCMVHISLGSYVPRHHWKISSPAYVGFQHKAQNRTRMFMAATANSTSADVGVDIKGGSIADDYYSVLGVPHDATAEEIKWAYYSCMKACHPDLTGEDAETTTFCMFVNEIYEILSDPIQRMVYDEINGYSLTSVNPFLDTCRPKDHVFVDEFTCIGCKNCANTASKTFKIEDEFGRARAVSQCGRTSAVQQAIDTCPVDCIHWVTSPQLSLLEDEMRRTERVNVGVMLSGMGSMSLDVFSSASRRWEKKRARAVEATKIRMMKEKNKQASTSWWQDFWDQTSDGSRSQNGVDQEVQARAAKAAAAARRWREYSRKGVDRKPTYDLPSSLTPETDQESENKTPPTAQN